MNLLSSLASFLETIADMVSNPGQSGITATTANPFESRAGLADVVTVHVVGPDGAVKESKSTNDSSNNVQKGTRP